LAVLLDTHVFLWWCADSSELSPKSRHTIAAKDCFVSLASIWELAIKLNLGKLELPAPLERYVPEQMSLNGFDRLEIGFRAIARCATMPRHHSDPFDRLLVAQAQEAALPIVSRDSRLDAYGIERIW
jgi:PIN domain nuclease of toxin-antitoxin system